MERHDVDERQRVLDWVARYQATWRAPGTDLIPELFTRDATYQTAPFEPPFVGVGAISRLWERGRDSHDERFDLSASIVAVDGPVAVVRVDVSYTAPPEGSYRNLWVLELDEEGRCRSFEEWPFAPDLSGWFEPGPSSDDPRRGSEASRLRGPIPSRATHRAGLEHGRSRTEAALDDRRAQPG